MCFAGKDFDECRCRCHKDPDYNHVAPCCRQCSICGKYINLIDYETHFRRCSKKDGPVFSLAEKVIVACNSDPLTKLAEDQYFLGRTELDLNSSLSGLEDSMRMRFIDAFRSVVKKYK